MGISRDDGPEMDAHPGLAPGRFGFADRWFDYFALCAIESGEVDGCWPRSAIFTRSNAAVTSRPPFEIDPPTGAAPAWSPLREECIAGLCHGGVFELVLPRGLAPRTSAFAGRRAGTLTLRELKMVRHAGAAPALCLWKRHVLAVTPMTLLKVVAASGIAPDSPRLQRGANLSQLRSQWSLRAVSRRGLSVIGRLLCF